MSISMTEARAHFSELINRVYFGKERIELERQGKPLVALISLEDLQLLRRLEDTFDILEVDEAIKEAKTKGTKTLKQMRIMKNFFDDNKLGSRF